MLKQTKIIIALCSVIAVLAGTVSYMLIRDALTQQSDIDPNATSIKMSISPDDGVLPGEFRVIGIRKLQIEANKREVETYLVNSPKNEVYLKGQIVLEDGTVLFESGMIPPGSAVYKMKMTKALEKGTYKAKVFYTSFSMDTREEGNSVSFEIEIEAR